MKEAVIELIASRGGPRYDPYGEIVITDGDGSAVLKPFSFSRIRATM